MLIIGSGISFCIKNFRSTFDNLWLIFNTINICVTECTERSTFSLFVCCLLVFFCPSLSVLSGPPQNSPVTIFISGLSACYKPLRPLSVLTAPVVPRWGEKPKWWKAREKQVCSGNTWPPNFYLACSEDVRLSQHSCLPTLYEGGGSLSHQYLTFYKNVSVSKM